jgi:hypothetical protein
MAVGQYRTRAGRGIPLTERWNGSRWVIRRGRVPAAGSAGALAAVSCLSARSCMAVGQYVSAAGRGRPLAERWNGTRWSIRRAPGRGRLAGVSCTSARSCMAVGHAPFDTETDKALAERWHHGKWTIVRTARDPIGLAVLDAVSCTSAWRCMAVGPALSGDGDTFNAVAERWNGRRWKIRVLPIHLEDDGYASGLSGVSCPSSRRCVAAGVLITDTAQLHSVEMLAEHWNGRRWAKRLVPTPAGTELGALNRIAGVSCASAAACTAAGSVLVKATGGEVTLAERWDGKTWSLQPTPAPAAARR